MVTFLRACATWVELKTTNKFGNSMKSANILFTSLAILYVSEYAVYDQSNGILFLMNFGPCISAGGSGFNL